jgi:gamma-glutamylcyclotransferase
MGDCWYFAYGSNLDIKQKVHRTGNIREAHRARIDGYRIVFNKLGSDGTGKANIRLDKNHVVWGIAYLCSPMALKQMDDHEGVSKGHYYRQEVLIRCDSGEVFEAITYVAGKAYIRSYIAPAPEYLRLILNGARNHGLPEYYIREIEEAAQGHD